MANIEQGEAPSSAQQLQEAGKMVVGAAGSVAVDRVRVEVDARSSRAAVELKALANAMRASASSLGEQGHDDEAGIVDQVAARADRLAARLASASTDDLVEDAKRLSQEAVAFARREPVLVIAGAFTIGLLIPKVLDTIAPKVVSDQSRSDKTDENQPAATPADVRKAAARK